MSARTSATASTAPSAAAPPTNSAPVAKRPAPPRLRSSRIPKSEPRAASRVARWDREPQVAATQGTLALALPNIFDTDSTDDRRNLPSAPLPPVDSPVGALPEPNAWAATFVQAAMEVAVGLRSPGQLIRWTTPEVHALLVRRGALTGRSRGGPGSGAKPRLRTLLSCTPRPGVCEVSAVIAEAERVRAVAFRLEGLHGRWRVTELEIG
jgi:hypothetical protein